MSDRVVHPAVGSVTDPVLRVTRLGTATAWRSIDAAFRSAMPDLLAQPGLTGAWFGRRATDQGEERTLTTVWRSAAEEAAGLRLTDILTAGDVVAIPVRIVLPLVLDLRADRDEPPGILRLYDGRTLPGQLEAYVEEARAGSERDLEGPRGPLAICMALDPPDRFLTASVWTDWASLETCTGGDIRRPLTSRNVARLSSGGPTHFEIIVANA